MYCLACSFGCAVVNLLANFLPITSRHRRRGAAVNGLQQFAINVVAAFPVTVLANQTANVVAGTVVPAFLDLFLDKGLQGVRQGDVEGFHRVLSFFARVSSIYTVRGQD